VGAGPVDGGALAAAGGRAHRQEAGAVQAEFGEDWGHAGDHETIHDRMTAVSDWQGVIRDIRLYELARQLSQNDGHLIPA
jgi:hypothetical protein